MSYIGNQPLNQSFLSDTFSGNGTQTAFTLSLAPPSASAILVTITGILQGFDSYGVVGKILTFTQPPPTGTDNIVVRYLSLAASDVTTSAYRRISEVVTTYNQSTFAPGSYTPGYINLYRNGVKLGTADYTATDGATVVLATPCNTGDLVQIESFYISTAIDAIPNRSGSINQTFLDVGNFSGSGAMQLPSGLTANRPTAPAAGMLRANISNNTLETYLNNTWTPLNSYEVDVLIVAGGGAGGQDTAGGGGAGGVLHIDNYDVFAGESYTVVVGAGGTRPTGGGQLAAAKGGSSRFGRLIAEGGGGGTGSANTGPAGGGGSGGGAGNGTGAAGYGIRDQGFPGFAAGAGGSAGGGGAGAAATSANGGIGAVYSISGTATYYGGGGAGNTGSGGAGGGGTNGGFQAASNNGTANTGGGGSGFSGAWGGAGNGGSGIVIVSYQNATQRGIGGTVTSYTNQGLTFWVHTFYSSGTFTA